MENKKLTVGILGVGGMGSVHLSSLLALSASYPIEIKAIADKTPENLKRALSKCLGAKGYETAEELLNHEKLDVIYVTLPSYLHSEYAVKALDLGSNVFVEKPLALSQKEGEAILEAEKRSGKKAAVGQVVRFFPEFVYLKELIENKKYGALHSLDLLRASSFPSWGFENWFYDEKRSGGVIMDLHVHDVDYLRYLFPSLRLVSSTSSDFKGGEVNRVLSVFENDSGASLSAEGVWHLEPGVPFISSYRAEFDEATLLCHMFAAPSLQVFEKGQILTPSFVTPKVTGNGVNIQDLGSYFTEDQYFLDCLINHKENLIAPLSEGYKSMMMALKELEMARERRKL